MGRSDNCYFFGCSHDSRCSHQWRINIKTCRNSIVLREYTNSTAMLKLANCGCLPRAKSFRKIRLESMEHDCSGRSGGKFQGATDQNVWKGGPFFPGQNVPNGNSCSVRVLQSHLYLIPLSAICGSFPVNVTDKCKWETRFMGTDLASETPLTRLWTNCWTGDSVFYLWNPSTWNRANSIICCWKT